MRVISSEISRCLTISEKHRPFYVTFSLLRPSSIRHTTFRHEKEARTYTARAPFGQIISLSNLLHVLLRHILRGVDLEDAIAPAVTMVDDGRTTGLLVHEQEEVMSNQLHLIQRLIDGHRLRDMQLATDDNRGVAYLDFDGLSRTQLSGDGFGRAVIRHFDRLLNFWSRLDDTRSTGTGSL